MKKKITGMRIDPFNDSLSYLHSATALFRRLAASQGLSDQEVEKVIADASRGRNNREILSELARHIEIKNEYPAVPPTKKNPEDHCGANEMTRQSSVIGQCESRFLVVIDDPMDSSVIGRIVDLETGEVWEEGHPQATNMPGVWEEVSDNEGAAKAVQIVKEHLFRN